jgi:hypothetical protein
MDKEILAAAKGGLKYWAFDWFAASSSFRVGWNLYKSSRYVDLINWCGIIPFEAIGSLPFTDVQWRPKVEEWAGYMAQHSYQKIDTGQQRQRPLLFIYWTPSELVTYFGGSLANLRTALEYLRGLVIDRGLGEPYIVILDGIDGAPLAQEVGASAISNYISNFSHLPAAPYRQLDLQTQEYWKKLVATGVPIVPIAMVGWDVRPLIEHPWDPAKPADAGAPRYFNPPSPEELAAHLRAAVDFIGRNPQACPSKVLLIYSWDECDEGGGLIPTRGDPVGKYLSAIAPIIS